MTYKKCKTFLTLFNKKSKVLIVINADPDSIACALAVKRLLWKKVLKTCIVHFNIVTRPDNLAMIEYTAPELLFIDKIKKEDYNTFVLVDSQPDHNQYFSQFEFDAIIDHHELTCNQAKFFDIRSNYGACATILTQYLKAQRIKPSRKLSAALMLGIKTDTSDFTRQASLKDIKAFQYLYQFADINIVTKVSKATFNKDELDFLGKVILKRKIINNRLFYHADNIDNPDKLVIVADFFLSLAKINWSIISGICNSKLIIIIRNDGLRKNAGNTAQEAFSIYGSAGGHKTMARAELDLKLIKKNLKLTSNQSIKKWIIKSISQTAGKRID